MKKRISGFLLLLFLAVSLLSGQEKVARKYRIEAYTRAVEKELGHKAESYETNIIKLWTLLKMKYVIIKRIILSVIISLNFPKFKIKNVWMHLSIPNT